MSTVTATRGGELAIPGRLNLVLLGAAALANGALLFAASHAPNLWLTVLCALLFSYTANTTFSLLHEAVHGVFHSTATVNRWAGRFAAAFFPTGFSLQRAYHLTHHRNNRSPLERFDYVQPGDVVWVKRVQWYSILTGVYWIASVFGLLVYLVLPIALRLPFLRNKTSKFATQTTSAQYFAALDSLPPVVSRLEILFSLAVQVLMFCALDLTFVGWALCYAAFAVQWSGLQYADHAFSPLDLRDGAWNLRVNAVTRALFLNYHLHQAHHQHPGAPWIHLRRLVDPGQPQPSYLGVWLAMWGGPRPLPASPESRSPQSPGG
jgi:fatty acid desaturase